MIYLHIFFIRKDSYLWNRPVTTLKPFLVWGEILCLLLPQFLNHFSLERSDQERTQVPDFFWSGGIIFRTQELEHCCWSRMAIGCWGTKNHCSYPNLVRIVIFEVFLPLFFLLFFVRDLDIGYSLLSVGYWMRRFSRRRCGRCGGSRNGSAGWGFRGSRGRGGGRCWWGWVVPEQVDGILPNIWSESEWGSRVAGEAGLGGVKKRQWFRSCERLPSVLRQTLQGDSSTEEEVDRTIWEGIYMVIE